MIKNNEYIIRQLKSNLEMTYVILTNGNLRLANIALISKVEVLKNVNDLILQVTGNIKNSLDGIYISMEGVYIKLTFDIVIKNISRDILKTYMYCYDDRITNSYDLLEYCRIKDKVKQVRFSNTGGIFLDWYSNGRLTSDKVSSFDGIWMSGKYIRILPVLPPSMEYNISEILFETFNDSRPFTSVGNYSINVNDDLSDNCFEKYTTINGIVIPSVKEYKYISPFKLVAIDKYNNEFIMFSSSKKEEEDIA